MTNAQSSQTTGEIIRLKIFSAGKDVGSETFTLKNHGSAEGVDVLTISGATANIKTSTSYSGTQPVSFDVAQDDNIHLNFQISGATIKQTGAKEQTATTDPNAVILENNIWYHYYFLVGRYDRQKGGVQDFKALVPSLMVTLPVNVELKDQQHQVTGLPVKLDHFAITAAGTLHIDIWADSAGKLFYIRIPSQGVEVIRDEYAGSLVAVRQELNQPAKDAPKAHVDYSAAPDAPYTAEEVTVKLHDYSLAGTLLLPKNAKGPLPAAIMITGSGQQTRDEPIPLPGLEKYRPFRQIAETLAASGIAVLRVDDRGVGDSTGRETLATATTSSFADDTRAQVAYLRTRKDIDPARIALIGHSEGGTIAPMVAASDPKIAAIVLLAGGGKRGEEISMYQVNQRLESLGLSEEKKNEARAQQREVMSAVINGGDLSKYPAQARTPWFKEFLTYDPIPTIRQVHRPILILQGGLDQQVTPDQAELLDKAAREAGNKDVTLKIFPSLNHMFLAAKTGSVDEYAHLETNTIGADVLEQIRSWLHAKLK